MISRFKIISFISDRAIQLWHCMYINLHMVIDIALDYYFGRDLEEILTRRIDKKMLLSVFFPLDVSLSFTEISNVSTPYGGLVVNSSVTSSLRRLFR